MFILTMIDAMPINYGGATVGVAEAGSIRECFSVEMRGSFTYASIDGGEILIAESDNNIIHGTYEANPAYQEPPTTEERLQAAELLISMMMEV